jgi:hypothetical protein
VNLKFGRPKITTNEKIVLASMFYPLYALAVQLSPELKSSGIQELVRTLLDPIFFFFDTRANL